MLPSSALMMSLVQGIPNNYAKKFNTFGEAVQAYTEAIQHGNVRRVRTLIQPSGHVYVFYIVSWIWLLSNSYV